MPDIALRFNKDMLVISSPITVSLAGQGVEVERDAELLNLIEPEAVRDATRLQSMAGAQCLVANTARLAPARMAHVGLDGRERDVAVAALKIVRSLTPQHVLVEIEPCGLPLDASSKSSLNENRDQYARAARACADEEFDAFFLNGFASPVDLKCALMGLRQVSDAPVFASVRLEGEDLLVGGRFEIEEATAVMDEFEASVAGFSTTAPLDAAVRAARRIADATALPLLAQLDVAKVDVRQGGEKPENPYYCPDTMVAAATRLRNAGVQFLRAQGAATPAYAGALTAATMGFDVIAARAAE